MQKVEPVSTASVQARPFEGDVRVAMQRVRVALRSALTAVNADPMRPQGMARQLGLDKNLAWKAARIITDDDQLTAISRLPGKAGERLLIDALLKAHAPSLIIDELRAAIAAFDSLVVLHAGDRDTLLMMLTDLSHEAQKHRDEHNRRLSFQGNSATWGVQVRTQLAAHFVAPARQPGSTALDMATICGFADFRRLRPDVAWGVAIVRQFSDDGSPANRGDVGPLDDEGGDHRTFPATPIMRSFCSLPVPDLRVVPLRDGATRYELTEGPVGHTASTTVFTGWYRRGAVDRFRTQHDWFGEHFASLSTPAELLIADLYIHRDLPFALPPVAALYSQLPGGPTYPESGRDRGLLPLAADVLEVGLGRITIDPTPEIPRFDDMRMVAAAQLGCQSIDFLGFRVRLRYPPIPSTFVFRYPLIEHP